ncbi:hypothetical protein HMN09_01363800 [Mycena chlorophos]|uniref:Uncharacterized protein n=1 Tax=Mycena chlorophos TaxID=658473 RepID=A0A8H6S038_MYCCL|nr:hypothetical protein HMN09_01363800 [Mycena chlorophos]
MSGNITPGIKDAFKKAHSKRYGRYQHTELFKLYREVSDKITTIANTKKINVASAYLELIQALDRSLDQIEPEVTQRKVTEFEGYLNYSNDARQWVENLAQAFQKDLEEEQLAKRIAARYFSMWGRKTEETISLRIVIRDRVPWPKDSATNAPTIWFSAPLKGQDLYSIVEMFRREGLEQDSEKLTATTSLENITGRNPFFYQPVDFGKQRFDELCKADERGQDILPEPLNRRLSDIAEYQKLGKKDPVELVLYLDRRSWVELPGPNSETRPLRFGNIFRWVVNPNDARKEVYILKESTHGSLNRPPEQMTEKPRPRNVLVEVAEVDHEEPLSEAPAPVEKSYSWEDLLDEWFTLPVQTVQAFTVKDDEHPVEVASEPKKRWASSPIVLPRNWKMQAGISGWNPNSSSSPALTSTSTDSKFNFTVKGIEPTTRALQSKSNTLEESDQAARVVPTQKPRSPAASPSLADPVSKAAHAQTGATTTSSTATAESKPAVPRAAKLSVPMGPTDEKKAPATSSTPAHQTTPSLQTPPNAPPTGSSIEPTVSRTTPKKQAPLSTAAPTSLPQDIPTQKTKPVAERVETSKTPPISSHPPRTPPPPDVSRDASPSAKSRKAAAVNSAHQPTGKAADKTVRDSSPKTSPFATPQRDFSGPESTPGSAKPQAATSRSQLDGVRKQSPVPVAVPAPGAATLPTREPKPTAAKPQTTTSTPRELSAATAPTDSMSERPTQAMVPAATPQANISVHRAEIPAKPAEAPGPKAPLVATLATPPSVSRDRAPGRKPAGTVPAATTPRREDDPKAPPRNGTTSASPRVAPSATARPDPSGVTVMPARESKPGPAPAKPQAGAQQAPSNPELPIPKAVPVAVPQPNVRIETPAKPAEAPAGRVATPVSRVREPHESTRETAPVAHEPKGTLSTPPKSGPGPVAARPDVSGDAEPNTGSGPGTATIHAAEPRDGGAHMRQSRKEVLGPVDRVPTPTPTPRQPTPPLRQPTPPPRPSPAPTPAPAAKKDGFWRRVGKAVGLI